MLAGISTASYYPELTERALDRIVGIGAQAAEVFFNAPSELAEPYVRELRRVADGGGVRILSVHPFTSGLEPLLFFSDYHRRFYDGVEFYKRFFHAANLLGAEILVFHGDYRAAAKPYSRYFDMFGELAEQGRRMGVTIAQENVPRCMGWCPAFFREMADYLPDARFVFDVKQCIRAGFTPDEMLDAMGHRVVHLHLSDHDPQNDCLPIGKGTLDLSRMLHRLHEVGFDGGVILELYRNSYGVYEELEESYRKILELFFGHI